MKKWLCIGVALLLLALLGWSAKLFFRVREPEYQGKKLSAWLRDVETATGNNSNQWRAAVGAVRAIGTNSLPALLAMLSADDPRWRVRTVSWFQDTLDLNLEATLASTDRRRGLLGFQLLGRTASPAIPELAALLTNAGPVAADFAFLALAEIHDPATVPALLGALTNADPILHIAAATTLSRRWKYNCRIRIRNCAPPPPARSARSASARIKPWRP